ARAFRVWRLLVTRPFLYRTMTRLGRIVQRPFIGKEGLIHKMAGIAAGWTAGRDLPPVARRTFHQLWKEKYAGNRPTAPTIETPEEK
ncbi:MAG TPA: hypothetical protein DDY32_20330, partial [Desulfobulbaceae bacterium]|nr:hypothetical protein [Desulfobulbaceae bacterium]